MAGNQQLFNVKPFEGSGFSNWNFRVKLLLEHYGVLGVVSQDPPTDVTELETFKKNDARARNVIVQCLADGILEMIKDKKTAKEIMQALEGTYEKKGISTQVQLQRKLRSLKFSGKSQLNLFLTEFEQTVCELKAAGGKIENTEVVSQLLSTMPESYQAVTTAIDIMFCQDEKNVTLDFVKNKLLMEEARQSKNRTENETNSSVVFAGYRSRHRQPKRQQKPGNNVNNYGNKSYEKGQFPFKCHGCGVVGHKRYQCPKNLQRQANVAEENNTFAAEDAHARWNYHSAVRILYC